MLTSCSIYFYILHKIIHRSVFNSISFSAFAKKNYTLVPQSFSTWVAINSCQIFFSCVLLMTDSHFFVFWINICISRCWDVCLTKMVLNILFNYRGTYFLISLEPGYTHLLKIFIIFLWKVALLKSYRTVFFPYRALQPAIEQATN